MNPQKLTVAFAAALIALPVPVQAYTRCTAKQLAGPGAHVAEEGANPVMWGSYVYAGYTEHKNVGVAVSKDQGRTLGPPVIVDNVPGPDAQLRLAAAYSNVYALWQKRKSDGLHLMFAASHDHGASWDAPLDLGFKRRGTLAQISADGQNVHAAYLTSDGNAKVRSSGDGGRTFAAPVSVGKAGAEIVAASLGQNVYVAWGLTDTKAEVMYAVSHDAGATFKTRNLTAARPSGANEPIFSLERASGRLSMVWRENNPVQGIYIQSLDGGDTWSAPLVVDAPTRQYMVADDGTYIYVSYLKQFYTNGIYDWHIYLTVSSDGGKSFPPGRDLSGPSGLSILDGDEERPIPWVWDGNNVFNLSGVTAKGVYAWNGKNGHAWNPVFLGPGHLAAPARNSFVWEGPNSTVMYGHCQ